jgi:methionyl-tRNA formyltransferase
MSDVTIGYFADGPWAHQAFDLLVADPTIRIAFVCARADNPDAVLRERSEARGIPFFTHPRVNSEEFLGKVAQFGCGLFVSMSFNQIFRAPLAGLPPLGTINCHAGKLPFYRGRNILNWALINDEKEFGITVHYIDAGIDTGDILAQRSFPITDLDDYSTLLQRAHGGCAELLVETIKDLQSGRATRRPQSAVHPVGFYCVARQPGDEALSWLQTSREVFNFVRAICRPGPQARTFLGGEEILINRVELVPDAPVFKGVPGAVVGVNGREFLVKTTDSFVKVTEWSGSANIRIGARLK